MKEFNLFGGVSMLTSTEKRKSRQILKQQRIATLEQIDVIEKQMKLPMKLEEKMQLKAECIALYEKLQRLVFKVRIGSSNVPIDLTKENYVKLKLEGYKDVEIAEVTHKTKNYIDRWKREQNINKSAWKDLVEDYEF